MCEPGSGQPVQGERMSYYIGFRHGWIRIGRRMLAWHDATVYPHFGKGYQLGRYKVRWQ